MLASTAAELSGNDWDAQQAANHRRLLARLPTAAELRKFPRVTGGRTIHLRCDRSMPFEFVNDHLGAFLSLWGARHTTSLSDYDPGLAQVAGPEAEAPDAHLLFVDWRLYWDALEPAAAAQWIAERAQAALRRSGTRAPVVLNNWPLLPAPDPKAPWIAGLNQLLGEQPAQVPGVYLLDLAAQQRALESEFFDSRNDALTRFPFSNKAAVAIARHLGLDLLPSLLGERIKGVILDLDDTLWRGVLGEDGAANLVLGQGHLGLHSYLRELKDRGVMLALCSRNERADVESLFRERASELRLTLDDFASVQINWSPKAQNIQAIAAELNVLPSALLFVDDNGSELAKAKGVLPSLRVLLADPEGLETEAALRHFPGLFAVARDESAALRTTDVKKNRERESLREAAGDLTAYLAALKMELRLDRNRAGHAQRLHELSQKTNQFNLALARLSRAEAETAVGPDHVTMTVSVKDALSDSGLVGVIAARVEDDLATVREVLFSCRVLGREVETVALGRFCGWLRERGVQRLSFAVTEGPRNQPARTWLRRFLPEGTETSVSDLERKVLDASRNHPATVIESAP